MRAMNENKNRKIMQWSLLWLVIITIAFGWKYPALGFVVPIVMMMGLVGSLFWGRFVCGNLCPRGGFLDRIISRASKGEKIPSTFKDIKFRWVVLVALMGFMMFQGFQDPANPSHWGSVFWTMCTVTTIVAILLGMLVHPRTWCAFCPMGTMQNIIGGGKGLLQIDGSICKGCKLCERSCSIGIPIVDYRQKGFIPDRDCLKCSECTSTCPKKALSWPSQQ